MTKALKPLIVVLLVLSLISLILGSVLFSRREVLKGRAQKHEAGWTTVAKNLRYENLDAEALKDYAKMDDQIRLVATAAENTYEEIQNTKKDLETAKADLGKAKDEAASAKKELADAQTKITELNDTMDKKDAELAQAKSKADQLEQDKTALQTQIDDLNNQLVKSEDQIKDLQGQVATLDKIIKDMEVEKGTRVVHMPSGLSGHVAVVNPDWNFVVLDIGSDAGVVANAEMMVHRADKLIGRVRISSVQKNLAIAEIMSDWRVNQERIHEGDNVLF